MNDADQREEALFEAALKLPPNERAAYLDKTCAGDDELRQRVAVLLTAFERAGQFMKEPAQTVPFRSLPIEKPGDRIGRYKLLEQIGEGGCGVVYVAEQEEPVRRRVALKVIKLGMDTKQVIARFDAEPQALALMDHPNIAKVLDAGATETGRSYFVMELVRGIKITDYCEQHQLSPRERLDLFVQVCRAIQHAHQKGVIHRDIKPSNILVTLHDGVPVPKVIDFGIAKATQGRLTDQTVYTAFEQFIGTPAYMSPEQAELSGLDIDTRSDIYSLGVLLYELLTGTTPFDAKELLSKGLDEMRRTIREVEPVKPSTRLTQELNAQRGKGERKKRGSDAAAHSTLNHQLSTDLDWIVMKCLEKDRTRRYETANGLATDIARHLNNEPINARPPSGLYRFRKLVRRNKLAFGAAMAVTVAAMLALVILVMSNVRIAMAHRAEHSERQKSDAANRELRHTVSRLELERAEGFFRAGDAALGSAHLAAILRRDPSNPIVASRLLSALLHRSWALRIGPPMTHAQAAETVFFSPDGRHLLSASSDATAKIWDVATGKAIATMQHQDQVISARYDSKGTRIVTASADGSARIWNGTNGTALTPALRHEGKVNWAEFSPNGESIVTASADKTACIWDAVGGAMKRKLGLHDGQVVMARFHPQTNQVVTGTDTGWVYIWNLDSGEPILRIEPHHFRVHSVAFSPDGGRLAASYDDGAVRLWSAGTHEPIGQGQTHRERVPHVQFSPDSQLLLSASHDGFIRGWDAGAGTPSGLVLSHEGSALFADFSVDGTRIVTVSMDNSVRVWDTRTGLPVCQPLRDREAFHYASFSPDGRQLVTASPDGVIQVWDIQPRQYAGIETRFEKRLNSVAFGPSGKTVIAGSADGTARVLDAATGLAFAAPLPHQTAVRFAEFSPDGERVVIATTDGNAYVWQWRTGYRIAGPLQHIKVIWLVRFSPEGTRVATASADGTARVWDARNGQPITPPLTHHGGVLAAQFSPDGGRVVTISEDYTARVWDARTGEPLTQPLLHTDSVNWAEFSPDGKRLITSSRDNTACIWDAQTGRALIPPLHHTRIVLRAGFNSDGSRVLTCSSDLTARVWDAAPARR
jgi:WD40 repeat protein/serine/threonine protein kinase